MMRKIKKIKYEKPFETSCLKVVTKSYFSDELIFWFANAEVSIEDWIVDVSNFLIDLGLSNCFKILSGIIP